MAVEKILFKIVTDSKGAVTGLKATKDGFQDVDLTVKNAEKSVQKLNQFIASTGGKTNVKGIRLTTKEYEKLARTQAQAKSATGATTSSVLELGRVISDAPYGIRGMANNLTQLVSQLAFAAKASGGFIAALRGMWTAMMGPLGIVLAVTSVISILDGLYGANKKAETSVNDLEDSFKQLADFMDNNLNVSMKDYLKYLSDKKKLDKQLDENSKKAIEIEERLNAQRQYRIQIEEDLAKGKLSRVVSEENVNKAKERESEIEKELIKLYKDSATAIKDLEEKRKKLSLAEEGTLKFYKQQKSILEKDRELLSKTSEEYKKLTVAIKETQLAIEKIEGKKVKKSKKTKLSVFETPEELELGVQNQQKAINKFNYQINQQLLKNKEQKELSEAKTEEEKKKIRKRYEKLRLDTQIDYERTNLELSRDTEIKKAKIKTEEHKKDLDRLLEKYKTEINLNEKLTPKQKAEKISDASAKVKTSKDKATTEFETTVTQITEAYSPLFTLFNNLAKVRKSALGIGGEDGMTGAEKTADVLNKIKEGMSVVSEFMNAETERQLAIERNKTNVLNGELNQRLINEKLSAEERKNIQNQIAQNDEALRKKQNKIKKKQFDAQKAFNISTAVINTYLAATGVLAQTKGGSFARIAGMIVTIGAGLAQVAAIARQKFQPMAPSTPSRVSGGGGSGSTQSRQPIFNIVGRSSESQLAEVIQGQFNKPVKAYVVSKEVTTQQQLDLNIQSSASI